jgi:hypothetical protein
MHSSDNAPVTFGDIVQPSGRVERSGNKDIGRMAGILLLVLQALLLGYVRFQEKPSIHLSTVGGYTSYRMFVTIDGRSLEPAQISDRYKIPHRGRTMLTPDGLHDVIRGFETDLGNSDLAQVRLHTKYNAGSEEIWLWPQM